MKYFYKIIAVIFIASINGLPLAVAQSEQILEGKHGVVVEDGIDLKKSKNLHYIETSDSTRYHLQGMNDADLSKIPMDKKIKVKGSLNGHAIKVKTLEVDKGSGN